MVKRRVFKTINSQEQMRYSNFELLRIIAMFLILFWHCHLHSGGGRLAIYQKCLQTE